MKFVLWKFQKYWIFPVNRTVLGKPKYFKPIKKFQNFWKLSKKLSGKSRIFLGFEAIFFVWKYPQFFLLLMLLFYVILQDHIFLCALLKILYIFKNHPGIMALLNNMLYIPKNFRISPNLPESRDCALARYLSLCQKHIC